MTHVQLIETSPEVFTEPMTSQGFNNNDYSTDEITTEIDIKDEPLEAAPHAAIPAPASTIQVEEKVTIADVCEQHPLIMDLLAGQEDTIGVDKADLTPTIINGAFIPSGSAVTRGNQTDLAIHKPVYLQHFGVNPNWRYIMLFVVHDHSKYVYEPIIDDLNHGNNSTPFKAWTKQGYATYTDVKFSDIGFVKAAFVDITNSEHIAMAFTTYSGDTKHNLGSIHQARPWKLMAIPVENILCFHRSPHQTSLYTYVDIQVFAAITPSQQQRMATKKPLVRISPVFGPKQDFLLPQYQPRIVDDIAEPRPSKRQKL